MAKLQCVAKPKSGLPLCSLTLLLTRSEGILQIFSRHKRLKRSVGIMGRPSITAFGLCLVCLLGNWQTGHARQISVLHINVREREEQNINCKAGEVIHIDFAIFSSRVCSTKADRTEKIRSRCDGRQHCKFVPTISSDQPPNVSMGDPCPWYIKYLKGAAGCWNPCIDVNCGEAGKCTLVTYKSYQCKCGAGYHNANYKRSAPCEKSIKREMGSVETYVGSKEDVLCNEGELIHVKSATLYSPDASCGKRADRTEKLRSRCDSRRECAYVPHWERNHATYINVGYLCQPGNEILRVETECRNPCLRVNCGKGGKCKPLEYNASKCVCGGADDKTTPACEPKKLMTFLLDANQDTMQTVKCNNGSIIHIKSAIYSGFSIHCPKQVDKTWEIRVRCENRQSCKYIPHREKDDHPYINMGSVCKSDTEYVRGVAECWSPCLGVDCGEGGQCALLTSHLYRCKCNEGYVNVGDRVSTPCTLAKNQ